MRSRFVFYDGGAGIMGVRRGNGMVGGVKTVALRVRGVADGQWPSLRGREGMPSYKL